MSSLKAKLNKHARSRFVKSAKGAKVLEESLGEDVTNFLNVINDMVRKHYGEKHAKKSKDDTYRMLAKFDLLQQEGKQDPELRYEAEKVLNSLTRQIRLTFTQGLEFKGDLQAAEVAGLSIALEEMGDALVQLAIGNMRDKNVAALKTLLCELSDAKFPQAFLYTQEFAEQRDAFQRALMKIWQDVLEMTGEEFIDTKERETKKNTNSGDGNKVAQPKPEDEGKSKCRVCAIGSCGKDALYSTLEFKSSPFCCLHHFKAFPDFNQDGDVSLEVWLDNPERRELFRKFVDVRDDSLTETVRLYDSIKQLNEEKDGQLRASQAKNILSTLLDIAGSQIPEGVQNKIRSLISEDHAPTWIYDSILPKLREKLETIYKKEFYQISICKVFLQTARLPQQKREELAWQLSSESHTLKGMTVGFKFDPEKDGDGKRPPKIDTGAVLQPFVVDKDRSPTIRRIRPGDEEEDPELPNGELRPVVADEKKESKADSKTEQIGAEEGEIKEDGEDAAETTTNGEVADT